MTQRHDADHALIAASGYMSWIRRIRKGSPYVWRATRWGVALLLSGVAAWLSIRRVQWTTLQQTLAQANVPLLSLALGTVLITTVVKAVRWQALLRASNARTRQMRVLRVLFIGQMGNSFLPARLGDVGRAVLVSPETRGGFLAALGTILLEKALDGIMGLLILFGLALWTPLPVWLRGPVLGLATLTGSLLLVLALASTQHDWAVRLYEGLTGWLPAARQVQARQLLTRFGQGLALLKRPKDAVLVLALSAVVWGIAALTNVVTLAALGIAAPGWSTWLVLVTGYVANSLPAIPAQVGVFEYACILALTAAGVDHGPALVFGLVLHLLVYGPPAILGPASMAIEGFTWPKLKAASNEWLEDDRASV
jgi:uncharacterized protein (TIRG00374 family)